MAHTLLIVLHAAAALLCFTVGVLCLRVRTATDLGAPACLVVLVAVAGVAGGIYAMNRVKARVVPG